MLHEYSTFSHLTVKIVLLSITCYIPLLVLSVVLIVVAKPLVNSWIHGVSSMFLLPIFPIYVVARTVRLPISHWVRRAQYGLLILLGLFYTLLWTFAIYTCHFLDCHIYKHDDSYSCFVANGTWDGFVLSYFQAHVIAASCVAVFGVVYIIYQLVYRVKM